MPKKAAAVAAETPVVDPATASGEIAASAEPNAPTALEGALRERILAHIRRELGGAQQEVLLSTKAIADVLGASANNVTYHLSRLVHAGHIGSRSAGPRGTWFRLGGGIPAPIRAKAGRGRAAAAVTPAPPKTRVNFCPYCGTQVQAADWRYCAGCGKGLK